MRWWRYVVVVTAAMAMLVVACTEDQQPQAQRPLAAPSAQAPAGAPSAQRAAGTPRTALPTVVFHTAADRDVTLEVEVADTPELSECGLMHRTSMPENQAMLFVFDQDYNGSFWNRNTFIPLTLAWIAADGKILALTDMAAVSPQDNPQFNTYYSSPGPVRVVIEANQGWFARHGVSAGDMADVSAAIAHGSQGAAPICREKGY